MMSLRRSIVHAGSGAYLTLVSVLAGAFLASAAHGYQIVNMNFDGATGLENPAIGPDGVLKGASAAISGGKLNLPNVTNPAEPTGRGLDLPLGPFAYAFSGAGDFQIDFDYQNNFNGIGGSLFSADGAKWLYDHDAEYDISGDGQYIVDDDLVDNQAGSVNIYVGTNQFVGFSGLFVDLWWRGLAGYTVAVPNTEGVVNFLDTQPHHVSVKYTEATGEIQLTADGIASTPFVVKGIFGRDNSDAPLGFFRDTSHDIIRLGDENNPDLGPEISPLGYAGKFDNLVIDGPLPPPVKLVVNRETGSMSIQVITTFNPDRINSLSIHSAAGTLISSNYLGIDASNPTFDTNDVWATSPATATLITESDVAGGTNDGAALVNGQTFVIDNGTNGIWKLFYKEDLKISVFDTTLGIELNGIVEYVGDKVLFGDLNLDGAISAQDYVVFRNGFDDNISGLSVYSSYFLADMNGDGKHNFLDFNAFAEAFDAANGVGGFAAMVAGIPEPSSIVLLALGIAGLARARVRVRFPALAQVFLLFAAASLLFGTSVRAAELVKYQFNTNFNDTSGNNRHGVPHNGEIFGQPPTVSGGKLVLSGDSVESLGVPLGAANPFGGDVDYTVEMKFNSTGSSFNPALGMVLFGSANSADPIENSNHSFSIFVDPQDAGGDLVVDNFDVGQIRVPDAGLLDGVEHSITVAYVAPDDLGDPADPNPGTMYIKVDANWRIAGQIAPGVPDIANHDVRIGSTLNTLHPFNIVLPDDSLQQVNTELEGTVDDFRVLDVATLPTLLRAEVDMASGEISILGGELPRDIRYYEITSVSGSLNPAGWNSFKEQNLDPVAPGTGVGERWDELIGTSSQLAEGFLLGSSLFGQTRDISLGNAFKLAGTPDLQIVATTADLENILVDVKYLNAPAFPAGDYNHNNVVDAADYTLWRNTLGQNVPNGTGADGDGNGIVQPADYTYWKTRFGNTGGPGAGSISVVPEPHSALLLMLAGLLLPVGCSLTYRSKAS